MTQLTISPSLALHWYLKLRPAILSTWTSHLPLKYRIYILWIDQLLHIPNQDIPIELSEDWKYLRNTLSFNLTRAETAWLKKARYSEESIRHYIESQQFYGLVTRGKRSRLLFPAHINALHWRKAKRCVNIIMKLYEAYESLSSVPDPRWSHSWEDRMREILT